MPLIQDNDKTVYILSNAVDKLEIAITAEIERCASLLPESSPQMEQVKALRKSLLICNGAGEGCKELFPALTHAGGVEMLGHLMAVAGMLGLDYEKVFSAAAAKSVIVEGPN